MTTVPRSLRPIASLSLIVCACSGDPEPYDGEGAAGTSGAFSAGGEGSLAGSGPASGGADSGGAATGGQVGTGGSDATGGTNASGGAAGSGGVTATGGASATGGATGSGAFIEEDGLVFIEIESAPLAGAWQEHTSVPQFTGKSYYEWTSGNSGGGNGVLTYEVQINKTGDYQIHVRNAAPDPTEGNDSYLKFPDSTPYIAYENMSDKQAPSGISNGWFKFYQNTSGNTWTYRTTNKDHDPHFVFTTFSEPGVYRVQISGRSAEHKLDRLALRHLTASKSLAEDPKQPESPRAQ